MAPMTFFYRYVQNRAKDTEFLERARPTVDELIEFLRGDEPITRDLRDWIAEMLDRNGKTLVRFDIKQRKTGWKQGITLGLHSEIAAYIADRRDEGIKMEAVIAEIMEMPEFFKPNGQPLKQRAIENIWSKWEGAFNQSWEPPEKI